MLQLIRNAGRAPTMSIKLDNQMVIHTLRNFQAQPAQSLLEYIHDSCDDWMHRGRQQGAWITISLVSGHDGIPGNEAADVEARRVISGGSSPCHLVTWVLLLNELQVDELPCSLTTAGSTFKNELRAHWRILWVKSP